MATTVRGMRRTDALTAVANGLPGLALAVAGAFHPHGLNHDSAQRWFLLHIAGLAVFPLVGVALAALMGRRRDVLAWAVRITAYLYATFYTALDVISGIAAGYVTSELGPNTPRPDEVRLLFRIGTPLGEVGSWALLGCCVLVAADQLHRHGLLALPGALLVPGAWLVHVDHIFAPVGMTGMGLIGLATAWLAVLTTKSTAPSEMARLPSTQR
jgi:hypothetical protein